MRTKIIAAVVAAACLAVWGTTLAAAGTTLSTDLVGAEERPGPGDPDGHGFITLTMNQGQGEICFELTASAIDAATRGHIHQAPAGEPGPIFVTLFESEGPGAKCVSATKAQIKAIRQDPEEFYVNIHTAAFPAGAIRGQLGD
ncbi:MAG TPA: CHRD domain-containing protein [Acidimicrobiia bacterium]|nr:CHRD domain-containing protein [Acidimicrobiia bacterium]